MKNFSLVSLALAATFTLSSAKAATTDSNNSFNSISFADGIDIEMVEGNAPIIESQDSSVSYTIADGILTLEASAESTQNARVRICAPGLKSIQYFGNSNVAVSGNIRAGRLLVSASGNGDITFNSITSHDLVCGVIGKGNIRINHLEAQNAKCATYGTGKVIMANETSDDVVLSNSRLRTSEYRYTTTPQCPVVKASFSLSNVKVRNTSTAVLASR